MFEGQERIMISYDWITIIFMVILLLIAITKFFYSERFSKLFTLSYSEKYYTDYSKNKPLLFNPFHLLFFIMLIFNISLLLYFNFEVFNPLNMDYDFSFFLKVLVGVILYLIIRISLGAFLGIIFEKHEEQKYFTFLKISNLSLFSIYLLPFLIIYYYAPISYHKFLLSLGMLLIIIAVSTQYLAMLKNSKINFYKLFYLFLYLCALEITPFIVVYKLIVS